MLLQLKKKIIYGPVNSRRLGRSLGINLFLLDQKFCSFNCVYCQYGWTEYLAANADHLGPGLLSAGSVKSALKEALLAEAKKPAYVTFSGNGEPTLHPDFARIVDGVVEAIRMFSPESRTAILSNSSTVGDERTRRALARLDQRIMKLDCGLPGQFEQYNQPAPGIGLEGITDGLEVLSRSAGLTLQTLISAGGDGNLNTPNVDGWIARAKRINPERIQLYTLDRSYPARDLRPANHLELVRIKDKAEKEGLKVEIF
jgi:wyosine [tRNA(Phe)-imidazoG37] synthetase (radical SAM superfamily)